MIEVEEVSHDATFVKNTFEGKVTVENVPPEEFSN